MKNKEIKERQYLSWKEYTNKKECQYYNKDFRMCNLKLVIVNEDDCKNCDIGERYGTKQNI